MGEVKTLIIGLGNPVFGDDNVGLRIARTLADRIQQPEITVAEASAAGLDLLDLLVGYDRAIIIDAVQSATGKAGQIYRLQLETLCHLRDNHTPHSIDFVSALELGRRLGLPLPEKIIIFGIEAGNVTTPGEGCTPEVESAIPLCVEKVLQELN